MRYTYVTDAARAPAATLSASAYVAYLHIRYGCSCTYVTVTAVAPAATLSASAYVAYVRTYETHALKEAVGRACGFSFKLRLSSRILVPN